MSVFTTNTSGKVAESPRPTVDGDYWAAGQGQQAQPNRPPTKQRTQADQDKEDEKTRKKAEQDLEQSWMDRLQLISVITTFFAATEAQLLSITTPNEGDSSNAAEQAANAGLMGGLVFHSFAAILSFTAAFVLVRYRLKEAKREKKNGSPPPDSEKQEIWSCDPHVAMQRVGYRQKEPPVHLLQRFHSLCIYMSVVGFILAAAGTLCFVWARQATSVGIFSSACVGFCIVAGVVVLFMSSPEGAEDG